MRLVEEPYLIGVMMDYIWIDFGDVAGSIELCFSSDPSLVKAR